MNSQALSFRWKYIAVAVNQSSKFSCSATRYGHKTCKLLIVGGGTGGIATASKFVRKLGKGNVTLIEPSDTHFYQPMWTLVGAGAKAYNDSFRSMGSVIPNGCDWIKDTAVKFDPKHSTVVTSNGDKISYKYLVVAMGMQLNYGKIKGLLEALEKDSSVVSNYCSTIVTKTFPALQNLKDGNAIFTFPNTPVKCAGAPQKIMYLADAYLRKTGKRDNVNINFNTALGVLFGVPKYAERLLQLVKKRNITVNYKLNLIEVKHETKEAIFSVDGDENQTKTMKYSFMHVTPPMSTVDVLVGSPLVDSAGYINVHKETLQHVEYKNVFAIGDCSNVPTSKTAAAVAAQAGILSTNLTATMKGNLIHSKYNGYTSCPLVTSYDKCILAEFGFDGKVLETFPIDQGKERRTMYILKKHFMPFLYWNLLLPGYWNGPNFMRKIIRLGM